MKFEDGDRRVRVALAKLDGRYRADAFWGWGRESDVPFLSEHGSTRAVAAQRMRDTLQIKGFAEVKL